MGKIVGIDLGTYNSAVAHINQHGEVEIIPASEAAGKLTTPSVVLFEGDEVIVGQTAKQSAVLDRERVADYFKRHVGDEDWKFEVDGKSYSPTDLQSFVLKKLKKDAEQFLNDKVDGAVITVPAHFSLQQRKLVEEAAKLADLEVKQIINEPTAAAIEYGIENLDTNAHVLVYDLGGGTFDVTIMQKNQNGELEILNNAGEAELGGTDWDERIREHVIATHIEEHGADQDPSEDLATFQDCTDKAEAAKITLSNRSSVKLGVSYSGNNTKLELTREKFVEITQDLMDRTKTILDQAISEAKVKENGSERAMVKGDIHTVLMVGGSCNMPMVNEMLTQYFEGSNAKVVAAPSLDFMVVKGATKMTVDSPGDIKDGGVKDVINHSVGVLVLNEQGKTMVSTLLKKNVPLGDSQSEIYYTAHPNQTAIKIELYEGENEDPELCTKLGEAMISGLPAGRPAGQKVKIALTSTKSGTIELEAVDESSGQKVTASMELKNVKDDAAIQQRKQELDASEVSS